MLSKFLKTIPVATLVVGLAVPAQAGRRLFGDSVLTVADGFSEEITGQGPAAVYIAGTESADALKAAVRALRKTNSVHLIRITDSQAAGAVQAYLAKRGLSGVAVTGDDAALAGKAPQGN